MDKTIQLERLNHLLDVALAHEEHGGRDTPLNGGCFDFNMKSWKCGSSACLLGSYVLTDYGKRFFDWGPGSMPEMPEPSLCMDSSGDPYQDAAEHFGISFEESEWLFEPSEYTTDATNYIPPDVVAQRVRTIIDKYVTDGISPIK